MGRLSVRPTPVATGCVTLVASDCRRVIGGGHGLSGVRQLLNVSSICLPFLCSMEFACE